MRSKEITAYSKKLLKGRRINTALICMLPVFAEIFIRFTEASVYSLLLYFGELPPRSLFTDISPAQTAIAVTGGIIRFAVVSPLLFASAKRLCEICSDNGKITSFTDIISDGHFLMHSFTASAVSKIFSAVFLAVPVFLGFTAYSLISGNKGNEITFIEVNACILTAISFFSWISLKISLSALPFLMFYFPEKNIFSLAIYTIKFMSRRKMSIIRLFVTRIPMLVVLFPRSFPEFMTALSLSISIYVKEDEYSERNNNNGRTRRNCRTSKLPYRKKRRFQASADKTQTAGAGNNL